MLTVHFRLNDAATGKPTPARVRFLGPDGTEYVPLGRLGQFSTKPGQNVGGSVLLGTETWHYIDGACEVRLPPGPIIIEARKGFEYSTLRRTVALGPGKMALRLAMERWTDARARGWFAGDSRAHYLSPNAALLESSGEDLSVVNVLAQELSTTDDGGPALPDLLSFSGLKPALEIPGHIVAVNTLNAHPVLGTVGLLNCHRPVYPLRFGAPGPDDWSVADWCDQCHRKKGLVTWPDLPRLTPEHPQGEALAAVLLGKIDAFEVCRFTEPEPAVLGDYYRLLDCGCRLPLVGGSGKDRNTIALGAVRTYAQLGDDQPLTYGTWIDAVRAGRTFITNGPLLTFTVDGNGPGAVLTSPSTGRSVNVRVEVQSSVPFEQVELLANGVIRASKTASGNRQSTVLEASFPVSQSTWLAARCWGRDFLPGGDGGQIVFAHSSPVYVDVEGSRIVPESERVAPFFDVFDGTMQWLKRDARCATDQERQHLAEVLAAGRLNLERRLRS